MRGARGTRWLALLLRLYPADFRAAFGAEIQQVVRDQRRALKRGRRQAARFWLRVTLDMLLTAPGEHLAAWRASRNAQRRLRLVGGLSLLNVGLFQVLFDLARPTISMGGLAWLVTAGLIGSGLTLVLRAAPRGAREDAG